MRTVAQQRPAPWLTQGEGNCGSYLLGHAGNGLHAGYGEQWIKALEAWIAIIPNPLQARLMAAVIGNAAYQTSAFSIPNGHPPRRIATVNTQFCGRMSKS